MMAEHVCNLKNFIPSYIATVTYNFSLPNSRSYIANAKTHSSIILDELSSDLWYLLVNSKNEQEIINFVKKNKLENEFDDFIEQLISLQMLCEYTQKTEEENIITNNKINDNFEEVLNFEEGLEQYQTENNFLGSLFFELTHKCNLDCVHCFQSNHNDDTFLTFEDVKKVIDDAIPRGLYTVTLSGGECTLNKDFLKIAKYIREKKLRLCIYTNGQALYDNPDMLEEVIKLYPYRISLSLYGITPEIHEKITKVYGSYDKTMYVIKKLHDNNVYVQIKCSILNINLHELKDIIEFGYKNKICIQYSLLTIKNQDKNIAALQISDEETLKLQSDKDLNLYIGNLKPKKIDENFLNNKICNGGVFNLAIFPNGDVSFCPSYKEILGNINNASIIDIWNGDKNKKLQSKKKKEVKGCFKEEYCSFCPYCPVFAMSENKGYGKSETLCKMAKTSYKAHKIIENLS